LLAQANILASRQVALALFNEVGVQNLAAFDSYAADPYYSHSTHVAANGTAAMKELIAGTFALNPEFSVDVKRVVAEGDLSPFTSTPA
jgi:predicted SnoaL-like aldol condensation-catalyzing enzyme